ncbi:hypothetical protein N0K08_21915 [Acidovorax sp. Be4]|uniref:Uncharacterized protein n=1 Tax=Acidovorax bellezanensis TaxID=2976702 RepID=A0ABT2PS46_9BURK|nr:hypothetical protein [Acidovorax sp. Be4]
MASATATVSMTPATPATASPASQSRALANQCVRGREDGGRDDEDGSLFSEDGMELEEKEDRHYKNPFGNGAEERQNAI